MLTTEGKTDCKQWNRDDWGGYERVLPPEVLHHIGKDKAQRLCDNKLDDGTEDRAPKYGISTTFRSPGKLWEQTKVTTRLVVSYFKVSYFNWIWLHSRFKTTAAQRAGLTTDPWTWQDLATYPTTN